MKKIIGYTTGVFDLFHIGHLNILKNAKAQCDELIVGVTSDSIVEIRKGKKTIISENERMEIVRNIKCVDSVILQDKIDEISDFHQLGFNKIFKGSDWEGSEKWNNLEEEFSKLGVEVKYFPYTNSTSSTIIRELINKKISG